MTDEARVPVTVEDDETANAIRIALYRAHPEIPPFAAGIIEPYLARHRLAGVAAGREWHTIETAPQDIWQRSKQVLCCHAEKGWIRFGRYYGELKRWYYSGTNERSQWAETPGDAPTHWQDMPAAAIRQRGE